MDFLLLLKNRIGHQGLHSYFGLELRGFCPFRTALLPQFSQHPSCRHSGLWDTSEEDVICVWHKTHKENAFALYGKDWRKGNVRNSLGSSGKPSIRWGWSSDLNTVKLLRLPAWGAPVSPKLSCIGNRERRGPCLVGMWPSPFLYRQVSGTMWEMNRFFTVWQLAEMS